MMEMEVNCGVYSNSNLTMKRERDRDMACVAEDLSMSANKKTKRTTSNNSNKTEVKEQNSRLPEGTFLKTDVITQIMDIQEPLASLRTLLENRLGVDLSSFQFWLQDKVKMLPQKSIGDQCIQTEGLAQVKVELKQLSGNNRINIIDVLKYSDDATDDEEDCSVEDLSIKNTEESVDSSNESSPSRWSIYEDINSLFPIPLPSDPESWTEIQIHHWLRWAMQEFKVQQVCESMWNITGKQLCQMDKREFHEKVPVDHHDLLWTHIELLRKCRIFAVVDKNGNRQHPQPSLTQVKPSQSIRKPRTPSSSSTASIGNGRRPCMTGHNGQIQLWQFLLELLGNKTRKNVIQWVGRNGEFKLNDPELVAQMWGERKNKPKMNYEKLSRALRYYYSESMIAKVHGRRFVYKFVCNLKELVGYTSEELISMVEEDLATLSND